MLIIDGYNSAKAIRMDLPGQFDFASQITVAPHPSIYNWLTTGGDRITAFGTGFTWDLTGPTGGTVTRLVIDIDNNGTNEWGTQGFDIEITDIPSLNLTTLTSSANGFIDNLTAFNNQANGTFHGDVIYGLTGTNTIDGGSGNDVIYGGNLNDTIYGGNDDDILYGGDGNDVLEGMSGRDEVYGERGDDRLLVGLMPSTEIYDGGDDYDTLVYKSNSTTSFDQTIIRDIEEIEFFTTSSAGTNIATAIFDSSQFGTGLISSSARIDGYNFPVTGQTNKEILQINVSGLLFDASGFTFQEWGDNGELIKIIGNDFNQILIGSSQVDEISGGLGDDYITGGVGADILDGGAGSNTLNYSSSIDGVTVDLIANTATGGHANGDTISNFSHILGSSTGTNTLTGNAQTNTLTGGSLTDHITGGLGSDILHGQGGVDVFHFNNIDIIPGEEIDGGDGYDYIYVENDGVTDFSAATIANMEDVYFRATGINTDSTAVFSAENFILGGLSTGRITGNDAFGSDDVVQINMGIITSIDLRGLTFRDWAGSGLQSDRIKINGDASNETIHGTSQKDEIIGGDGNDFIWGGAQGDVLAGGGGTEDTLSYENSAAAVTVDIGANTASGGDASTDTISGFENLTGSGFGDTLKGSSLANTLRGNAGTDILWGYGGSDTLYGGDNDDTLHGGNDADTLLGDAGDDTLYGNTGNDTLFGSIGNDILNGGNQIDTLYGEADDDTLNGGSGGDTLNGGSGLDTLNGDGGDDTLNGDADNDTLNGGAGSDTLYGGTGDDTLDGGDQDDFLYGGDNNDTLKGGAGTDTFDGGTGIDVIDYSANSTDFTIDMSAGTAILASGITETFTNVENFRTGAGADTITGDVNDNEFFGGAGNDRLTGGAGDDILHGGADDDTLIGGEGNDTYDGGNGFNTVSFEDMTTVNLQLNNGSLSATATIETYSNIQKFSLTAGDDYFFGDSLDNQADGSDGDDEMSGFEGADILSGGDGNDTLTGGNGGDTLVGGTGSDTAIYTSSSAININLDIGAISGGEAAGDTLSEIENVTGGFDGDYIAGDHADNVLKGNDGIDTLQGRWGFDTLIGGNGNDRLYGGSDDDKLTGGADADILDGGDGMDTARYFQSTAISINLDTNVIGGGEAVGDTLISIENVIGGAEGDYIAGDHSDNVFTGNGGIDTLQGRWGFDTLIGGGGDDRLYGGSDDDLLEGGLDADILDGGDGMDTAIYTNSAAISLNLDTAAYSGGEADGDTLTSIENVIGGGEGDYIAGDHANNRFEGGGGSDILQGRWGDDTLIGGSEDDFLYGGLDTDWLEGGTGGDLLDGGDGTDTAIYSGSTSISINLFTGTAFGGEASGDTLTSIENITGSTFSDYIAGDYADNRFEGGDGNDTLQGRWGADTLLGGLGNDRLFGGADIDLFVFESKFGQDKIMDFDKGVEKIDVSAVSNASAGSLHFSIGASGNLFADFGGVDTIEFVGFSGIGQVSAADFIF